jgi:ribosomal protein S12 methylthiotransferase accessory factor
LEASVHALTELLERDATAINCAVSRSRRLSIEGLPDPLNCLVERIHSAELRLIIRYSCAVGNLPYFEAYIVEPILSSPIAVSAGFGLHLDKTIALTRAITEAAQARLSHIHGGRDDIIQRHELFRDSGPEAELLANQKFVDRIADNSRTVLFESIDDRSADCTDLDHAWSALTGLLKEAGIGAPLVVPLTPEHLQVQVVRVIAPGLEQFEPGCHRVGLRLMEAVKSGAG